MAKKSGTDDKIIQEAKDRFKRCQDWESLARSRFIADRKFANGDSDNGWQWIDAEGNDWARDRMLNNKPCLTINKTRQHNLQIINDARQNKPSVTVRPVSTGATYEAAQVFEGIVRHIEYISNAQSAYDRASTFQVEAGIGYWRVLTDYADNESLDQEIFIRPVKDPLSIYLDPDIREADGSDARFGFIFDDMSHDELQAKYPEYKDQLPAPDTLGQGTDWVDDKHVRVAEYYRKSEKRDQLISWVDPDTQERQTSKASKLGPEIAAALLQEENTRSRDVSEAVIEWRLIIGEKVIEKKIWPGIYIPIVRVIGEETVIEGVLDRKGHTRALKDPQRQYNFWTSGGAEFVALQTKSPYVTPLRAIEGLEKYWDNANREDYSALPYNDIDDAGQPIAAPKRSDPPVMAPAYVAGMGIARQELMEVSGQYQAEMGAPSNEKSGKAIQERQRQGDNATYHFIDHQALAIRFTGRIILDLIPKIYDTPRTLRILGEDGSDAQVELDPQAKVAYQEQKTRQDQAVTRIFNPNVGRYDVQADVGPDYGTQRRETFNAIMQLIGSDPEIKMIVGDILFKAADFPMADELAERFARLVPPQAMGGPSPQVQQMQAQLGQLQQALQSAIEELAAEKKKVGVEAYKAETDRIALGKDVDPATLLPIIHTAVIEALKSSPLMLPSGAA